MSTKICRTMLLFSAANDPSSKYMKAVKSIIWKIPATALTKKGNQINKRESIACSTILTLRNEKTRRNVRLKKLILEIEKSQDDERHELHVVEVVFAFRSYPQQF